MLKRCVPCRFYHAFQPRKISRDIIETLPSHELLQHLGFLRQTQSGLVNWLPIGLRSLNKIENIVRNRMNGAADAMEVQLSTMSPKNLWETTGRWSNTELFKLRDARKAEFCLTPTCEEDITNLMKNYISTYKDMPLLVYQITKKYRDELRPRGGLLRGREFLMKDAYSFTGNKEDALKMFAQMNAVYEMIFTDLGIPFVSAWADSGDIGGDLSKEYHYIHSSGEDTLLTCDHCGTSSNIEKCESFPQEGNTHMGEVNVKYALNKARDTLICFYYPKDRSLNWNLAIEAAGHDVDGSMRDKREDEVLKIFRESNEDLIFSRILRIMDCRLNSRSNFPDFPLRQYLKSNFGQIDDVSIVEAREGEICGLCSEGLLKANKTIEVGHTFHLGTKYSQALEAQFTDRENKSSAIEMGCYGIGVSRLLGAIGEITRDKHGFRWPSRVAPYQASICVAPGNNEIKQRIKQEIQETMGSEVMDKFSEKVGLGARISYSHAIGIPLCIIAGPKNWPNVEIEVRGKNWFNDDTPSWREAHKELRNALQWQVIEGDSKPEKHIVPIEHLSRVITLLFEDL
ncbi:hypothetical protein HG536_0B05440 [Torulaspora globosa]|uniref:proline--tRNA ligase n=1 Tax=Torulaspora globosa TaxID=48254 RepID=A0A7G3ZDU3_9SACH|nr:uncharacterized protein HG536_0B05440 [Torulaspora globosa]QLL31679.1 hypothetical protein HG536_0B05440 [Torulaspora globosa]